VKFTWDELKRISNRSAHPGVDFEDAKPVFRDSMATDLLDDRFAYGEERWVMVGRSGARFLAVVYVQRGDDTVHIISAREATRKEIDDYFRAASD
jgi:uncharacterized protein